MPTVDVSVPLGMSSRKSFRRWFVAAGFPTDQLEAVSVQRKETQSGCAPCLGKTNVDAQIGFDHVPPLSPVKRSPPDFSVALYLRQSLSRSNVLIEALRNVVSRH